jgi:PIN domain nuclease of toxin-antitoxin system
MRLLIDTHILVWIVLNDHRLSVEQRAALADSDNAIVFGAATAYELAHLQKLGRIPLTEPVARLQELVGFETAEMPFNIWQEVAGLPDIHRDPIDRMLIAHARLEQMTLVTADTKIRRYPVPVI